MPRAQISWKSIDAEGTRREVYAEHEGDRWLFFTRGGRYDLWQPLPAPSLEDWLELLDGVRRRIPRRWFRPEEEGRLKRLILERYPKAELGNGSSKR